MNAAEAYGYELCNEVLVMVDMTVGRLRSPFLTQSRDRGTQRRKGASMSDIGRVVNINPT